MQLQLSTLVTSSSTSPWKPRYDGELETTVNGSKCVVFRAGDFSGWNGAINGHVVRGTHFRMSWPTMQEAQSALARMCLD